MAYADQFDEATFADFCAPLTTFDAQDLPLAANGFLSVRQLQAALSPVDLFVPPQFVSEPTLPPQSYSPAPPATYIAMDSFDYPSPSSPPPAPTSSTYSVAPTQVSSAVPMPMCNYAAAALTPSTSIDNMLYSEGTDRVDSEGDCGSAYDDEDDSQGEDLPEVVKRCPNTKVIENKPKRGGRRKKDAKPREELLPPPSPETLNDPVLMQEYRQERNRLAAKRSRERKKDYVSELEETCQALKNHNEELSKELLKMRRELQEIRGKFGRKKSCSIPEGLLAG